MKTILITGAAGGIGMRLRQLLKGAYPKIRLSDVRPPQDLRPDEEFVQAELGDLKQVERAVGHQRLAGLQLRAEPRALGELGDQVQLALAAARVDDAHHARALDRGDGLQLALKALGGAGLNAGSPGITGDHNDGGGGGGGGRNFAHPTLAVGVTPVTLPASQIVLFPLVGLAGCPTPPSSSTVPCYDVATASAYGPVS